MRVPRLKMVGFEKQKIIQNLVTLEKRLILDDDFQDLPLPRKFFSPTILDNIMKDVSTSFRLFYKTFEPRGRCIYSIYSHYLKQNKITRWICFWPLYINSLETPFCMVTKKVNITKPPVQTSLIYLICDVTRLILFLEHIPFINPNSVSFWQWNSQH